MLAVLLLSRMSIINAKRRASRREKAAKAEKLDCDTPEDVYCRTCLGTERLMPLFEGESDEKRSHDLKTVTGLEIKKNDGLSQQICSQCTDVMNQALQFRRRSRKTEKALLNMCSGVKSKKKYSRRLHKSIEKNSKMKETKTEKLDMDDHYYDSYDYQNCDDYYDVPVLEEKRKIKQKLPSIKKKRMSLPTTSSYKCSTCSKEFRMKATYKAHMRFHTNYCVCESCGKRCRNNNQLQEHKRARHGLGRIHKCAYCEYSSATKEALTIHERRHTGERPYVCDHCGATFHRRSNLVQHIAIHLPEKNFQVNINDTLPQEMCSICVNFINDIYKYRKKCEESQRILESKIQDKHYVKIESQMFKEEGTVSIDITDLVTIDNSLKDYNDINAIDDYNDFGKEDHFITDTSDVVFEPCVKDILEKPAKVIESKKNGKTEKPVRKKVKERKEKERVREEIKCEHCHKILTSKLSLRNHYKIHTGFDVVCEHCGKKFITRRLLLMHCRAKHGYEKTDKCSYCDYKASNAEQVKIHERLHTGEKPYVCKDCNAGFHRKSSYLQHIAIHLPEKTVPCDQCDSRFKSVTLMRIHKNRHRAPQYSFRCRVCDNSFARRRNVVRHLQRIHGLQPEEEHIDKLKIS